MTLSSIDANLLVVLDAVLSEKSVARAAKRLHVTPPAVSNALARLREIVGDPLVVRSGRGIVATPRALELAPTLSRALAELDAIVRREPADPHATTRELTLAIADGDQVARLPALAARMADRMPDARLRVVSIDTLVASGGLAGTVVDAVVGPGKHGPGVKLRTLFDDESVLVVRARDRRKKITKTEFNEARHVDVRLALGDRAVGNRVIEAALASRGLVREVKVIVPTFAAVAAVVGATDLLGMMPAAVAKVLAPSFGIRVIPGPLPRIRMRKQLAWHERSDRDPVAAAFRALVTEAFA